jgi:uncharacterized phage protein gp47/JayE
MSNFPSQHKDDIQQRMTAEYEKISDKSAIEGSFSRDLINANSVEFQNAYAEMDLISQAAFSATSWGDYLTMKAAEYGIDRKTATKAIAEVTVHGNKNTVIPAGSLFQTTDAVQFKTDSQTTTDDNGDANISVTAVETGKTGNVLANTITKIPMSISGISTVTNVAAAHDGYDEETDDELMERYMLKVRTPATSGNTYHYKQWALSIDGVGAVKIIPLWAGPGTVKVIITDSNHHTASSDLIKAVADYIETVRPIGATVTVVSPAPLAINIKADVTGTINMVVIKDAINTYFSKATDTISLVYIGKLLLDSGLTDYENLTINGDTKAIKLTDEQLPCLGEVILNG